MDSALDVIIKEYIRQEIGTPIFTNNRNNNGAVDGEDNTNYIKEIHDCLERKGVMRELQAFLRQRLVSILQDKWPQVLNTGNVVQVDPIVLRLILDFLACRKLLFTLSVFASEMGLKNVSEASFKKLNSPVAETLLTDLRIPIDSRLNQMLLRNYLGKEERSLLECIVQAIPWSSDQRNNNLDEVRGPAQIVPQGPDIDLHMTENNERRMSNTPRHVEESERLSNFRREMEKDNGKQLQAAMKKFREEEEMKISKEIRRKMETEFLSKEKEKVAKEKVAWSAEEKGHENAPTKYPSTSESPSQGSSKDSLLVEAKTTIEQLIEENRRLRNAQQHVKSDKHKIPNGRVTLETRTIHRPTRDVIREMESDKIAFLQYNLEEQSREISFLKQQLSTTKQTASLSNGKNTQDNDILTFLNESKHRCEQIEQEAKYVEKRLLEIRKSRILRSPSSTQHIINQSVLNNTDAPMAMAQLLQSLLTARVTTNPNSSFRTSNAPQSNLSVLYSRTLNTSTSDDNSPPRPTIASDRLRHTSNQQILKQSSRHNSIHEDLSENDLCTAEAVERGALSFEKLIPSGTTRGQKRRQDAYTSNNDSLVQNILHDNGLSPGRRVSFEDNGDDEEPVKLQKEDNSEKSASVSLSGPQNKSNRSQDAKSEDEVQSDFWKL